MRTTLAGLALTLAALLGSNALAAGPDDDKDTNRDAGKRETIRGVVAGVTIEGETTVDYSTGRAQVAEAAFLTVVGSPTGKSRNDPDGTEAETRVRDANPDKARGAERNARRHNVYILSLTPKTVFRDASSRHDENDKTKNKDKDQAGTTSAVKGGDASTKAGAASLEKLEVGDTVRVAFAPREPTSTSGNAPNASAPRRFGRNRTYFGDAVTVTIVSLPDHDQNAHRSATADTSRDDDKDKVKADDKGQSPRDR